MTDLALEREALSLFEALLDEAEEDRDAWLTARTAGRPELRARLDALREADRRATLRTGAAAQSLEEPPPPERIGAYRIVERIGRGGMGTVYRGARDVGDFEHMVAIKVIKPGPLSESLVARFRRERQILAALRHPNIAQLLDGGETTDGFPYIVMEHVDGVPLMDWAERSDADLRTRLSLFLDICGAVAFAHRSLVVHRDLTPSNVLVSDDGVVKLIDFGIARPPETSTGDEPGESVPDAAPLRELSMTPGYAAPERMVSADVTTSADIYSLGRLLHALLAREDRDAELTAIIGRAAAVRTEDRYPTVEAMSDDVRAWRDGRAVAAMCGGKRYLAKKFFLRHRWGVGAAGAAAVVLVAALSVTLAANRRVEAAMAETEARFQQTRAIARALLFDVYDEVSRVTGATQARVTLAETGIDYLNALASDENAPIDVRLEAAQGFIRLSRVIGGGQSAELGRIGDAEKLLSRGEAILHDLHRRRPDAPGVRTSMADLWLEQSGNALYNDNDAAKGRALALQTQALLADDPAHDAETARLYAVALQAEGDSWGWDDDYAKARDAHQRAEAFIAGLPPALQGDVGVRNARSANLRLLGEAHHRLDEAEAARTALERAIEVNRGLLGEEPDSPALIRKLATSLWYGAVVHRSNGRDPQARDAIDEAVALARRLRDRDPSDAGALRLYGLTGEVQAQVLSDLGRFPESFSVTGEVIAAYRRLAELADGAPGARRSLAMVLRTGGGNHYNGRDYGRACSHWREALGILNDLDREGALSPLDRNNSLAEMRDYVGRSCEGAPPRAGVGPKV